MSGRGFVTGSGRFLGSFARRARAGLLPCFDGAVLSCSRRARTQRCGAIFYLHGLGDLVLGGHAIEALIHHMHRHGLRAVLFVPPSLVEFARRFLPADAIEAIDRWRFTSDIFYRARCLRAMACRYRFELAVQPGLNRQLRVEDCLMRASAATERIGSSGIEHFINADERWWGDGFYTRLIAVDNSSCHELEHLAGFLANLHIDVPAEPWPLRVTAAAPLDGPYLAVCPYASGRMREWPFENFMRAAHHIAAAHGWSVVVLGDRAELPIQPDPQLLDLRQRTTVNQMVDVLANARFILCNDSGPYHMSVSLGRSTLGVGGDGAPRRYFPYPHASHSCVVSRSMACGGCWWECIHTASKREAVLCIRQISWQEVVAAAEALLRDGG